MSAARAALRRVAVRRTVLVRAALAFTALAWGARAAAPAAAQMSLHADARADSAVHPAPARAALRPVGSRPVELRPGDVVKLYLWREPDISRDYEVDAAGRVALPKLGSVAVAGFSPDSLKRVLELRYARYLRDPSVEVSLRRRISVLGSVRNPGIFLVDPYTTVAEALALAGGPSQDARIDYVRVRRGTTLLPTRISTSTPIADAPVESGDQLYVPDRGWTSRNLGVITATLSAAGVLLLAIRRR